MKGLLKLLTAFGVTLGIVPITSPDLRYLCIIGVAVAVLSVGLLVGGNWDDNETEI